MTHTIVGIFDSKQEARTAVDRLVENGFMAQDIDLSSRRNAAATTGAADTTNEGIGDKISDFFTNLFSDDEMTNNYSTVAAETEGILTVHTDSKERAEKAAQILDNNGAVDVNERAAQYRQQSAANNTQQTTGNRNAQSEMTIPVVEENLQVGKQVVETGGVRVRSRIVEKPVEETLRLREEHVVVNRRPVNRAATDADFNNLKEGEMEITERAERAVVGKEARVVEEVAIGKTVEAHEKTVSDTVRKTEVDVEKINTDTKTQTNRT